MAEIHKSKISYCVSLEPKYDAYDAIVARLNEITPELVEATRTRKAHLKTQAAKAILRADGAKQAALREAVIDPATIKTEDIIFRVMTSEHIPLDPDRKRKGRGENSNHTRTPFLPFKHYIIESVTHSEEVPEGDTNIQYSFKEVLRSHWRGDFETGVFDMTRGKMTHRLAVMFMMLVDRYSRRSNWRSYTYLDEMKSHALLQLSQIGLQFNEAVSDNPFAFYTTTIKNCISGDTEILTKEYGSIAIEKVAGQDVHLLDGDGNWVECQIFDHGVQETQETVFTQGRHKVTLRSTLNHGWISNGEIITTDQLKDHRWVKIDSLRPNKVITNENTYRQGVIHGIVYGDGSGSLETGFTIRICKNKTSLSSWFSSDWLRSYPDYFEGDEKLVLYHQKTTVDLKKLPDNPGADLDYLLGFMRGWLATDGCVATQNNVVSICAGPEECDWIKQWSPLVGWQPGPRHRLADTTNYGKRNKESHNILFYKSTIDCSDLLNSRHIARWVDSVHDGKWNVYKHTYDKSARRFERVYCPIVRTTSSFALANGIHSRNCFTRILNLEKKNQNIRDDILIMHGANPSYTRQNNEDHERALARNASQLKAASNSEDSDI